MLYNSSNYFSCSLNNKFFSLFLKSAFFKNQLLLVFFCLKRRYKRTLKEKQKVHLKRGKENHKTPNTIKKNPKTLITI